MRILKLKDIEGRVISKAELRDEGLHDVLRLVFAGGDFIELKTDGVGGDQEENSWFEVIEK